MAKQTQESPKASNRLVSVGYIAGKIDRPTPWVEARMGDLSITPALTLDDTEYFELASLELLREAAEEQAARVVKAKREAQAAGL